MITPHLLDLRWRVIALAVCWVLLFLLCFTFREQVFSVLQWPLRQADQPVQLISVRFGEMFFIHLSNAFWLSLFAILPLMLVLMWGFVAPGLLPAERRIAAPFIASSPLMFYAGVLFAFFLVVPVVMQVLAGFVSVEVAFLPTVHDYLNVLFCLCIAFGLAFQLPLVVIGLAFSGVVPLATFQKQRPFLIVGLFIVAAVLTPPDVVSQLMLALPLWVLFEGALLITQLLQAKKAVKPA